MNLLQLTLQIKILTNSLKVYRHFCR